MYMPLMVDLKKVVVLGGDRGEGLQKTQKFAVFADELLVVPEEATDEKEIVLSLGPQPLVKDSVTLEAPRRIPVTSEPASIMSIATYCRGATLVSSDLKNRSLNEFTRTFCGENNILCNVIDTKELCTTWLMSIIDTPDFEVALSTKGRCAFYAAKAREELTPTINSMGRWGSVFAGLRLQVPDGVSKARALEEVYRDPEFRRTMDLEDFDAAKRRGEEIIGKTRPGI